MTEPLKRGKPLQRKTPLRSIAQLKRSPLRRKKSPTDFTDDTKRLVERRSGGRCEATTPMCNGKPAHHHHRKPRSAGGDNSAGNDLFVCSPCHTFIHTHPAVAYERGWLIRRYGSDTGL